jgi:hypothetical protein
MYPSMWLGLYKGSRVKLVELLFYCVWFEFCEAPTGGTRTMCIVHYHKAHKTFSFIVLCRIRRPVMA